ncbi:hypothetical protein BASA81_013814 [Batrachochytrium salamandrivorans]|nr:hypothetical protein BASA81_013814 [Batrachochytrium salamandrivorans]
MTKCVEEEVERCVEEKAERCMEEEASLCKRTRLDMFDVQRIVRVCNHFTGKRVVPAGLVEIVDRRVIDSQVYYDIKYVLDPKRENNVLADFLCDEPVRRSLRRETAVDRVDVQLLFDRIAENCQSIQILRTKQFLDSFTNEQVLERMFDLLEENTSVQALYVQNLENGMTDFTLGLLARLLERNPRIWAVNVGENFKITKSGWETFANALSSTSVTHLYAGSESTVYGELKVKMRLAIRNNRTKHNLHCSVENLPVIQQIGQMWWNPKNSLVLGQEQVILQVGEVFAYKPVRVNEVEWAFGQVITKGEDLLHLIKTGMEEKWINVLQGGGMAIDKNFQLSLAFHCQLEAWWPALYFNQSGLLVFAHAKPLSEAMDDGDGLWFESCECREQDYILPFEFRLHPHVAHNQDLTWKRTLDLLELRAVEFFSPKMDVGLLPERPLAASHELCAGKLTEAEACAVIDHLWFQELLHLDGATQVQSIYTCLLLDPLQLTKCQEENKLLYTLLMHTLQFCDMNHSLVLRTQVCFEEDFTLHSNYGIEFGDRVTSFKDDQEFMGQGELIKRLEFRRLLIQASGEMEQCRFEQAQIVLKQCTLALAKITCTSQVENNLFDQQCNLFRISPQPPKPFISYVQDQVVKRFGEMIRDLEQICTMHLHCNTLVDLLSHVCYLSNIPTLNAFTRSRLFYTLIDKEQRVCGVKKWHDLVVEDVGKGYGPQAVVALDAALPHALQAVFETFRVLCYNPARQRRRLVHRIEDFGNLAQQFELVDAKVGQFEDGDNAAEWDNAKKQTLREEFKFPLGNWGNEWCLRFMIRFMELGAMKTKMDLVRYHDVPNHVYYLFYLYRMLFEYEKRRLGAASPATTALLELKRHLCLGSIQFLIGTQNSVLFDKQPKTPEFTFPRLQFEHRFFEPFSTVCLPKTLSCFEIYMSYHSPIGGLTPEQIFDQAEATFKKIRLACTQLPPTEEIKGFTRLAIVNSVNIAQAKQMQASGQKMQYDTAFETFGLGHVAFNVKKQ